MTLHRAPLPVECNYNGMTPVPPLSIDNRKIMKGAVHSVCVFCVSSSAYTFQLSSAIAQIAHCVVYDVLSSLDGRTQCLKLVWESSCAFLKVRFLFVLTL